MTLERREFLSGGGAAMAAGLLSSHDAEGSETPDSLRPGSDSGWEEVRAAFDLLPGNIEMSAMLLASHPRPVREAIERHRRGLDHNPVDYLEAHYRSGLEASRSAAGDFMGTTTDRLRSPIAPRWVSVSSIAAFR